VYPLLQKHSWSLDIVYKNLQNEIVISRHTALSTLHEHQYSVAYYYGRPM